MKVRNGFAFKELSYGHLRIADCVRIDVLGDEGSLFDGLQGLYAPPAAVGRPVDAQLDLASFLNDAIETFVAALAPFVAFVNWSA